MRNFSFKMVIFVIFFSTSLLNAQQMDSTIELSKLKYGEKKIAVGSISVNSAKKIKIKPDIAQFSITYTTEGTTPNDASNRNVENMKNLKTFMSSLGIKDGDITTINYNNYQRTISKQVTDKKSLYQTELGVSFMIPKDNFYNTINMLEENGVSNIYQDKNTKLYNFTILKTDDSEEKTKDFVQNSYKKIESSLKKLGAHEIVIIKYETKEATSKFENVNRYFVSNTILIKTSNFDSLGKVISKAQELKMTINNDMVYSVSDEQKNRILSDNEATMFEELEKKANRTLTNKKYSIGAPVSINLQFFDYSNQPRYRYYDGISNSLANQKQTIVAQDVSIETPSEFEITLSILGTFEIVQDIVK